MPEKSPYQQLAESVGMGTSPTISNILKVLANEDEAKILLAASPPANIEEIAQKTGLKKETVEKMVDPLFRKGLLFKSKKDDHLRYYRFRNFAQLHDATAVAKNPSQEMLDLWKEFMHNEWPEHLNNIKKILPKPFMRVIPVNISIEPSAQIMAPDDVKKVIDNASNIAVTNCACRVIDGKCGSPMEVCIQVNRAADYSVERGTGRKISKENAIEILKKCEKEGLVHVADNKHPVANTICNCCYDCCLNWEGLRTANMTKLAAPSRFVAVIDIDRCTSCGICLDRCHFGAINMKGEHETACVTEENCMGCGLCAVTCPEAIITLKETKSVDFIPQ
ncbi:MAG: 4Fe-4S ferredoxin [Thermodesulfobacteriota bacterium]|nr:4Fe-4S ferredoxin [Thermodesulfobacteriota bacterium]